MDETMDVTDPSLVRKQNVYRAELALVHAKHDFRRASWKSLVIFTAFILVFLLRAASMWIAMNGPKSAGVVSPRFWTMGIASTVLVTLIMVFVGVRRDAKYAKHAWDRLRFAAPNRYAA